MKSEEVLEFWFDAVPPCGPVSPQRLRFWFNGGEAVDGEIRQRFGAAVEEGGRGKFDHWQSSAHGALALIILLDQFPRNIYRNSPGAYAWDSKALAICRTGLKSGYARSLSLMERSFFYLPLEHAEDLSMQELSVSLFSALLAEAPSSLEETCRSFLDYAVRHRDIIARFGRFPHRNQTLGRASSPEEQEFLTQPGSSF